MSGLARRLSSFCVGLGPGLVAAAVRVMLGGSIGACTATLGGSCLGVLTGRLARHVLRLLVDVLRASGRLTSSKIVRLLPSSRIPRLAMKLQTVLPLLGLATLLSPSWAFQTSVQRGARGVGQKLGPLSMSDAAAAMPEGAASDADDAPPAPAPAKAAPKDEGPQKVPCFGASPWFPYGTYKFFGENYWDKLTMEYGSAATGTYLRAAELKHGRAAMLGKFADHKITYLC